MTNKKLVWRLSKLPTTEELANLVKDKIITQDEAREILFSSETEEDRDKKSLESEIKFLRELVEKLSKSRTEIITTIREIEVPYRRYPWYSPYVTWCQTSDLTLSNSNSALNFNSTTDNQVGYLIRNSNSNFSSIKTF